MGSARQPGPDCQVCNPVYIDDGTLGRFASPRPGPVSGPSPQPLPAPSPTPLPGPQYPEPDVLDQFHPSLGGATPHKSMGEEAWFERRYPNWLNHAEEISIEDINSWVYDNWGATEFKGPTRRFNIYANGSRRNDNRFEKQGDKPQSFYEAFFVLGSFNIDVVTPLKIIYSKTSRSGLSFDVSAWESEMYVDDVLGYQTRNPLWRRLAPSRRIKRAKWKIQGEQMSYVVKTGDTLSKIALAAYGNANLWKRMHDANRALIPDPDLIRPGQRLTIPKK